MADNIDDDHDSCWIKQYELTLELYSLGAEIELGLGNTEKLEYYCEQVLQRNSNSRGRGSQIGAWASNQSQKITSKDELHQKEKQYEQEFAGKQVPLPEFWGGYRVVPHYIEFWQGRPNRLHDRIMFELTNDSWTIKRLAP